MTTQLRIWGCQQGQTGTVRSVADARALGGQQFDSAVTGCHISTLFPKPPARGAPTSPVATADAAIQHMFGAALELNAAVRTLREAPEVRELVLAAHLAICKLKAGA